MKNLKFLFLFFSLYYVYMKEIKYRYKKGDNVILISKEKWIKLKETRTPDVSIDKYNSLKKLKNIIIIAPYDPTVNYKGKICYLIKDTHYFINEWEIKCLNIVEKLRML